MNILSKFLQKRGIKSADELNDDEKTTFNQREKILSEGEVTVDAIRRFCQQQIDIIETKWKDLEYQNKEKLIPYHTVYKLILGSIDGPKSERENLERYLNLLIEKHE
jgi:hypothetical protein